MGVNGKPTVEVTGAAGELDVREKPLVGATDAADAGLIFGVEPKPNVDDGFDVSAAPNGETELAALSVDADAVPNGDVVPN